MSTLATFIQHSFGSPSYSNQRRETKGIQIGKKKVKLPLFADDMILYTENPKDATRKLLELISEFSKIVEHKIKLHKSFAFVYSNQQNIRKRN